jgi:KDO2-lipid IV(A) lauroyltransferase
VTVKHIAEHVALRTVAGVLNALPYRVALLAAWKIAGLAYLVARSRVAEAKRRIRLVFGDQLSAAEVNRIAWRSWRNTAFSAVEMLRIRRITPAWLRARCDCDAAMSTLERYCATGRGAVLAAPHMGNWELAALAFRFHAIPAFSIAARQRNPLADAWINRLRAAHGVEILARGSGGIRSIMLKLRAGRVLAILPDVRVRSGGLPIPFLGGEANIGAGMALFARHAGVPIFPCLAARQGWTRHVYRVGEPVWPDKTLDKDADVRRMTTAIMRFIEEAVRAQPEQWFWYNRRWILDPLDPAAPQPAPERTADDDSDQ